MSTEKPTYSELKEWFNDNIDNLPKTLDCGHIIYNDVTHAFKKFCLVIDREIERHGYHELARSRLAWANKHLLYQLYISLKQEQDEISN